MRPHPFSNESHCDGARARRGLLFGVVVARADDERPGCPAREHFHSIDHDLDDNYYHDDDHHNYDDDHHHHNSPAYNDNDAAAIA